jgi:phosphopantothenoylcysteine synthetase/decarboxylase
VGALARSKVHQALFDLTSEAEMGHIELSRSADLLVVAPATADLLAKMAAGGRMIWPRPCFWRRTSGCWWPRR